MAAENDNQGKHTEAVQAQPATEVEREQAHDDLGFISRYADYADVIEAPRKMHEIVAIQLVASILNRNGVLIPHGGLKYPLDLWVVLLSGSGHGRSTLVQMARPLIKGTDLTGLVRNSEWGSLPACYQDMAENSAGLFIWGELSQKFKLLNQANFGGLKEWITDRYDNLALPEARTYRDLGRKGDTPPIEFPTSPRINILATSSEEWFFKNLDMEDSAGGFVPRWVLVRANEPRRYIPTPVMPDAAKGEGLVKELRGITDLDGEADLTEILPLYEEWYEPTARRFDAQANRSLAGAYFNRHRAHVLKLAVIFEAATSRTLKVSEPSWYHAVTTAKALEETIFSLLGTGMSGYGYQLQKAEEYLRAGGADGVPLSAFTRTFQHSTPKDRELWLKTLEQADAITCFNRKTGGRTAVIYVHRDFLKGQEQEVPAAKVG